MAPYRARRHCMTIAIAIARHRDRLLRRATLRRANLPRQQDGCAQAPKAGQPRRPGPEGRQSKKTGFAGTRNAVPSVFLVGRPALSRSGKPTNFRPRANLTSGRSQTMLPAIQDGPVIRAAALVIRQPHGPDLYRQGVHVRRRGALSGAVFVARRTRASRERMSC